MMKMSMALFTMVFWVVIGAMLKKFSNFLSYLILMEGVCVSLGGMLICCQGMDSGHSLFVFLVLVACETSLGLSLMVGILRNSDSGVYSLYSQSA
uniref:NADH dehydrogenase subunit 4L n=2 Tax=Crassostrea sikamea TaxID=94324 RepID=D7SGQ0_CRASI|nr:NADH dehydrogenase subunit 4L [Crassostrea sikamea]ACD35446.1 NADH dehydrogenase subunit 4L [Crassostrea sikamea]AIM52382.1 NADH dehydrogenase subunit 4L [Crassostrea sikamea]AIM52395.1 NADH dehydrogenase subunit 4L [Crassostrea sikamea]AIM52408.1 NADH dehydrogenase subunit 4L [Crassostrea sikamea]AIM52421.1 NADH dehydrogenase subunit 4L [Crassostrea sikamea]